MIIIMQRLAGSSNSTNNRKTARTMCGNCLSDYSLDIIAWHACYE